MEKRIYDHHLELSEYLGVEPVIITRPEYEQCFKRGETRIETTTTIDGVIPTLYRFRDIFSENFCWIAGDMLFTELSPLKDLLNEHLERGNFTSFFLCKESKI